MKLTNFEKLKNGLYQAIDTHTNDVITIKKNNNTGYWDSFKNDVYLFSHEGLKWAKCYLTMA